MNGPRPDYVIVDETSSWDEETWQRLHEALGPVDRSRFCIFVTTAEEDE